MRGRWYRQIPVEDAAAGDVVVFNDGGSHTRIVVRVTKASIIVDQPKGFKPKTKRVSRKNVKECWRRSPQS